MLGSPDIDDLLTLIPSGMYRALISSAQVLGYEMKEIEPDDALSHFYSTIDSDWQCPPSFSPTMVQRQIPPHPWLDLFPIPRMRDNMILAGSLLNEGELCTHLVGFAASNK